MRRSPCPVKLAPRVSTTQRQHCPLALIVMGRVSIAMGPVNTLLTGVMSGIQINIIVKTPECGELISDFVHTQPFGKT